MIVDDRWTFGVLVRIIGEHNPKFKYSGLICIKKYWAVINQLALIKMRPP